MANKTLQNTIDWVSPIIRFMPLNIGSNNEPAITNANMIQQTVLSPPFCWAWNRKSVSFSTVVGQQDYVQSVSDFGFIETANVTFSGDVKEISIRHSLALDSRPGRPDFVSAEFDDNAGNITFRLLKIPDKIYTLTVTYQKKPVLFTALANNWSVPDEFQYVCNYGFLTLALLHLDDPRTPMYNQKFMTSLLSASRGLSEMERNIFIGNWLALTRQEMTDSIKSQQGQQVRGV